MILSDKEILKEIENSHILIEPFRIECLGSNSYDVHLGRYLSVYKARELDARSHNEINEILARKIIRYLDPKTKTG